MAINYTYTYHIHGRLFCAIFFDELKQVKYHYPGGCRFALLATVGDVFVATPTFHFLIFII